MFARPVIHLLVIALPLFQRDVFNNVWIHGEKMLETKPFLVKRPRPRITESLVSYYLRLSEANGFDSPWQLLKRASMQQTKLGSRGAGSQNIAEIARFPEKYLDQISYCAKDDRRAFYLLGHRVISTDIEPRRPKICLECVTEKGFVEAQWDLAYMVGCPVHDRWATTSCSKCGSRLSVFRRGLLKCHCGSSLLRDDDSQMPSAVRSILGIVRARVLNLLPFAEFDAGIPVQDLHQLELRTLLRVIAIFGGCQMLVLGPRIGHAVARLIVSSAAEVLSEWPLNFHSMLRALAMRNQKCGDVREQFAPFYSAVFKRRIAERTESLDFIRKEFLKSVTDQDCLRRVDIRTLHRVRAIVNPAFVSGNELARRLQIDPRTVKRHAGQQPQRIGKGPHLMFASPMELAVGTFYSRPNVIALRQAAASIGLPVSVLRALKDSGDFEVKSQMPLQIGFRHSDIVAFKARLMGLAPVDVIASEGKEGVTLGICMKGRRYSSTEKAILIRKLLDRTLPVIGLKDGGAMGVMVSSDALSTIIRAARATAIGETLSGSEAAEAVGCELEVIRDLIRIGVIDGEKKGTRWHISASSVAEFTRMYLALASVASDLHSSSRRLSQLCRENHIDVIFARNGHRGMRPFIRESDRAKVDNSCRNSSLLSMG